MPLAKLQTNASMNDVEQSTLSKGLSALVARELKKPESYVMVVIEPGTTMLFAGTNDPLCYLELKSIGLPESKTKDLSLAFCTYINEQLAIEKDRIYVEFSDAPRAMWGWNGGTF